MKGILLAFGCFVSIMAVFWYQEWKYLMPTPVPANYVPVKTKEIIHLDTLAALDFTKPVFLHFFSPDCPCSKYNIAHIQQLVKKYGQVVHFYAILFADDKENYTHSMFEEVYHLQIPVIMAKGNQIAANCGVYSTPQAVILEKNNCLFYRGNYNKSRYCSDKNSNFAEIALQKLLAGETAPDFGEIATKSYGCELPIDYYN
jgi:hypothetical protein